LLSRRFQQVPQSARVSECLFSWQPAVGVAAQIVSDCEHRKRRSSGRLDDSNRKEPRSTPREPRGFPYLYPFDSGRCHA
jgi:hypothetical protein